MTRSIRPTEPEDLPELSRFMTSGFEVEPAAEVFAPDVLLWKYFDADGGPPGVARSLIARDPATLRIEGHIAMCLATIHAPGLPKAGLPVVHGIDWLVAERGTALGAHLMMRVHKQAEVAYAIGVSPSATRVILKAGYVHAFDLAGLRKVLRPTHWLRMGGSPFAGRALRAARDAARASLGLPRQVLAPLERVRLDRFRDADIVPVLEALSMPLTYTRRDPERLNHLLRYPRGGMTGWSLRINGRVRGIAILNVLSQGSIRRGKLVDCFLDSHEADLWVAALHGLTEELHNQRADTAELFASAPWMVEALKAIGYRVTHSVPCYLRDRRGLLQYGAPWHLTPLEADYSHT